MEELTPKKFASEFAACHEKKVLLDVRTPQETSAGCLKGAVLIPLKDLSDNTRKLPSDSHVFIYCLSGGRAVAAAEFLEGQGFTKLSCAVGGGYPELRELFI